jgi:hypothetical protein
MKGKSNGRRDEYQDDRQRDDSSRDRYSRDATFRQNRTGDREYSDEVGYDSFSDARSVDKSGRGRGVDDGGRQRGNGRKHDYESDNSNLRSGNDDDYGYSSSKYSDPRDRPNGSRQPEKPSTRSGRDGEGERAKGKSRGYDDDYSTKDRYHSMMCMQESCRVFLWNQNDRPINL